MLSLPPPPGSTNPGCNPRDFIGGLEKGLAVIEAFDLDKPRLSITEVANRAGLSRAAARRYLLTLTQIGYAHHDGRCFSLTPRVLRLSQSYLHSARLPRILQPHLAHLAQCSGEACTAGVLDEDDVISIAACSGGPVASPRLQQGTRVPAYCSASGRVLIAFHPNANWQDWVDQQRLLPLTGRTVTNAQALLDALSRARQLEYALVDRELEPGLRSLAVPLHNRAGRLVAALNLGVRASRYTAQELLDTGLPLLRRARAELMPLL